MSIADGLPITIGETGSAASTVSALAVDGTVIAFVSAATEFASGDTNGATDVFVRASLGETSTYTYDRLSRLTGSVEPVVGSTTYAYDPVGNRTSRARGTTTTSTYDRPDRLTAVGATPVTTNAAGEVVARGSDTFGYDGLGRLVSAAVGSVAETYAYDGDGNRVSRTSSGATTPYVLDTNRDLPVILADGARKYVWGAGLLYATTGSTVEVGRSESPGRIHAWRPAGRARHRPAPRGSAHQPRPLPATGRVGSLRGSPPHAAPARGRWKCRAA